MDITLYFLIVLTFIIHMIGTLAYSAKHSIIWLDLSRLAGTLLAQLLLVPAAMIIVFIAERI